MAAAPCHLELPAGFLGIAGLGDVDADIDYLRAFELAHRHRNIEI